MNFKTQIESIHIYRRDIVVKRFGEKMPDWKRPMKRGDVQEFSWQSRRKLAFVASNTDVVFQTMITLTYPDSYPLDGSESKRHLRAFLQYLRRVDTDVQYLWFLEFQRRGAPHFHLLMTTAKPKYVLKKVSERWYKIVGSGDGKHLQAGTRVERLRSSDGGCRYAVKYAMKMRQKCVPKEYQNCGLFWSCSKAVRPVEQYRVMYVNDENLRLYLLRWSEEKGRKPDFKVLFGATDYFNTATGYTNDD